MKQHHLIPVAVFIALLFSGVWIWFLNEQHNLDDARANEAIFAEQIATRLESSLSTRLESGQHLRHEWAQGNINTLEEFRAEALSLQFLHPEFHSVNWIDRDGVIRWVFPQSNQPETVGLNLKKVPLVNAAILNAGKLGKLQVTSLVTIEPASKALAAYYALGAGGEGGFINFVFHLAPLIRSALDKELERAYNFQIFDGEVSVYATAEGLKEGPLSIRREFSVANRTWALLLTPTPLTMEGISSPVANFALLLFLIVSAGLAWLFRLFLLRQKQLSEQSHILGSTLGNMDEGISVVDADLNLVAYNQRFLDLLNFPQEKFHLGDSFESFIRFNAERGEYGEGDIEALVQERVKQAKTFEPHKFERTLPNGTVLEIRGQPMPEGGFVTSYTDVTENRLAEKALQQSEERFAKAFNSSPAAIAIAGITDGILYDINEHWCDTTGYQRHEVLGKSVTEIGLWKSLQQRNALIELITQDKSVRNFEGTLVTKHGEAREFNFNGELIDIDNEERLLLVFNDITEHKQAEKRALHLAGHDPLTGLPNRSLMRERLEQKMSLARSKGSKVAVMFIDLNDFKQVNDRLGHRAGDEVLQIIAGRLKNCVRGSDTVARFGGDEFIILMSEITEESSIVRTCEQIDESLSQPVHLRDSDIHVGASIGISLFPDHSDSPEALIELADKTMYDQKNIGENVGFSFAELPIESVK